MNTLSDTSIVLADPNKLLQVMMNLCTNAYHALPQEGGTLEVRTPLIDLTKAEIIQLGTHLGVDYSLTVSCYQADSAGRACGVCDSCRIREAGFIAAGVPDPTRYQAG